MVETTICSHQIDPERQRYLKRDDVLDKMITWHYFKSEIWIEFIKAYNKT